MCWLLSLQAVMPEKQLACDHAVSLNLQQTLSALKAITLPATLFAGSRLHQAQIKPNPPLTRTSQLMLIHDVTAMQTRQKCKHTWADI